MGYFTPSGLPTYLCLLLAVWVSSCWSRPDLTPPREDALFSRVDPAASGITFQNTIPVSDSLNILTFEYVYNGGGVGVGDFNKDGLTDLFFVGNKTPGKLYINKGNFRFQDVTPTTGIRTDTGFPFGVAVTDVNQDGWPDIYISVGGPGRKTEYLNQLYINQHDLTFKESAAEYGLTRPGQCIQATFFDYDHDGDLDLYQVVGGGFENSPIVARPRILDGSSRNTDRLYLNDFDQTLGHPVFTDVSKQAGIVEEGFGLGVSLLDINDDGWLDLYVTNDYLSSDLLYVNNQNGTFTERVKDYFQHTSHFAMGNDVGDINNDGLPDVMAVDMLPEDHRERMLMFGPNQYDKFQRTLELGYSPQYMRNTLQLNRGQGRFSEIGQLAGVYKTSWSWAVLFADLDNDEYQDLFITNGFGKNVTDLDFVKYRSSMMGTVDRATQERILLDSLSARPPIKTHHYAYRNQHDCAFRDVSTDWGFDTPTIANGAAYADLDNDGDLDLITNSLDAPAGLYRNQSVERNPTGHNYLKINLEGGAGNRDGVGSEVKLHYGGRQQVRLCSPQRGFESSVDPVLHFGLGQVSNLDTLTVRWPDGRVSLLTNVKANQTLTIRHDSSRTPPANRPVDPLLSTPFLPVLPASLGISYRHTENLFNDFNYEKLLPHQYSRNGPPLATADVNGDGLDDFVVGGAFQKPTDLFVQRPDGTFRQQSINVEKPGAEIAACLFFDADNDHDADLLLVTGSNEFSAGHALYQDKLLFNDGQGHFTERPAALPVMLGSGSCAAAADYDGDGDLDLFIGGGIVPGRYPTPPDSYLLQNNGGTFRDVTDAVAPALRHAGMVTASLWTDYNADKRPDLVLVGEWMPITLFANQGKTFANVTPKTGLKDTEGWWQTVVSSDFDNDGDLDFVVGNWGKNHPYRATATEPMSVCYGDFDKNGTIDPIISYYEAGTNYPASPWDFFFEQIPSVRKRIFSYQAYANTTMDNVREIFDMKEATTLYCRKLESVYVENLGNGQFRLTDLPMTAQLAPLCGLTTMDVNDDGFTDVVGVGNQYGTEVVTGRYDASHGMVLLSDGKGHFREMPNVTSGFWAEGNARAITWLNRASKKPLLVVSRNSDALQFFSTPPIKDLPGLIAHRK